MFSRKQKYVATAIMGFAAIISANSVQAADLEPITKVKEVFSSPTKDNFYISLFGGTNIPTNDTDFDNGAGLSVTADRDVGFTVGGALGYKWKNLSYGAITPRTELEVNYFQNDVGTLDFSGNGPGNEALVGDNQISGVGVFGNLFFDWNNAFDTKLTPYVGGGIGVAFINTDIVYNGGQSLNDNDTAFAFNVGGGASYQLTDRISLFTDARYIQIVDVDSDRFNPVGPGGGNFEDDLSNVQVRSGLSIRF